LRITDTKDKVSWKTFGKFQHSLDDAAGALIALIFLAHLCMLNSEIGQALSLSATSSVLVDRYIGLLKSGFDVFNFVGGSSYIIVPIEGVDDDESGLWLLYPLLYSHIDILKFHIHLCIDRVLHINIVESHLFSCPLRLQNTNFLIDVFTVEPIEV
jgi:hypothetical protein